MADGAADDLIGGFRRLAVAGTGSQGAVWKARCEDASAGIVPKGTVVALKISFVCGADAADLWRRLESRVAELRRMEHPNVVKYLGCFRVRRDGEERHVIVQEFLEGETLKERLAHLKLGLDVDEGLRVVKAAAQGLAYAAGRGVFHRDVKPANIFLTTDGGVKLIDFGVAKQEGETIDGSSNLRGTFNYMAPDFMLDGAFRGDAQSDIFSLGVVFHEIVTGRLPYDAEAASDVTGWTSRWMPWSRDPSVFGASPVLVDLMSDRLLIGAADVLEKSLTPDRGQRFPDFAAFIAALDTVGFYDQKHEGRTYRRLQFIGRGGFGEVFKARWLEEGMNVAVKQLLNPSYARRFHREAKVMRQLTGSCFVRFVDFFATAEHAFLVMAFLGGMPGSSLRDAINRAGTDGLPKALVFSAFERYARGLALMHAQGIIHRDIKPSNLYYPPGRPDRVAIMDFGIVRDMDGTFTSGTVPCTLDFAPPEIVTTANRGGPAMDIYALGLCLYESLTGRTAYPRLPSGMTGIPKLCARAQAMTPPTFDDPRVTSDPDLLKLLVRMTEPDVSKRLSNANEVAFELRRLFCRKDADEDCPPTVVFDRETDATQPLDESRLMDWYREWRKVHPDEPPAEEPTPVPQRRGHWKAVLVAFLAVGTLVAAAVLVPKLPPLRFSLPVLDDRPSPSPIVISELETPEPPTPELPTPEPESVIDVPLPTSQVANEPVVVTNVMTTVVTNTVPNEADKQIAREKAELERQLEQLKREREAEKKRQEEEEAERRLAEAEKKRLAEVEAEKKRQEEAEAERRRQAEVEAEKKRQEEAEKKRQEEAEKKRQEEEEADRKRREEAKPVYSKEVLDLVEDARFYGSAGQNDQVVKFFHDAFVKGYRLTEKDMELFVAAFNRHNDFLKREIERLESEEYRKNENHRSISKYKEEQLQLLEWYRKVVGR